MTSETLLHLVLFDLPPTEGRAREEVMAEVRKLATIHGVTDLIIGTTVDQRAPVTRAAFLLYLSGVSALATYERSPIHLGYARTVFLPNITNLHVGDFPVDARPPSAATAFHPFFITLKDGLEPCQQESLIVALRSLDRIPGVLGAQAGMINGDREARIVGGCVFLRTIDDFTAYVAHPLHEEFMKQHWEPVVDGATAILAEVRQS